MKKCGICILVMAAVTGAASAAPEIVRIAGELDFPLDGDTSILHDRAVIGSSGHVVFLAQNGGKGMLYSGRGGELEKIYASGESAPGSGGGVFTTFRPGPSVGFQGDVWVEGLLTDGRRGLWRSQPGNFPRDTTIALDGSGDVLRIATGKIFVSGSSTYAQTLTSAEGEFGLVVQGNTILAEGDPVPVPGYSEDCTVNSIIPRGMNAGGAISCVITTRGADCPSLMLKYSSGSWEELAVVGGEAPENGIFQGFGNVNVAKGSTSFIGTANEPNGDQRSGAYIRIGQEILLIARSSNGFQNLPGDPVADINGATYTVVREPQPTDLGTAYFRAVIGGAGITARNDDAIFRFSTGGISLLARENGEAPGFPGEEGIVFNEIPERLVVSPGGRWALVTNARLPNGFIEKRLWVGRRQTGILEPVLRVGGEIGGKTISDISVFAGLESDNNFRGRTGANGLGGPFNQSGQLAVAVSHPDENVIYRLDFGAEDVGEELQLSKPQLTDQGFEFAFPAEAGKNYRIESSRDFGLWETVDGFVRGVGGEVPVRVENPGELGYFRVVPLD